MDLPARKKEADNYSTTAAAAAAVMSLMRTGSFDPFRWVGVSMATLAERTCTGVGSTLGEASVLGVYCNICDFNINTVHSLRACAVLL